MPHKQNTILTENLCGLARLVRAYANVAHENIATWAARDISHSSAERVIFPDAFQVTHFMLRRLNGVVSKIVVNADQIEKNLNLTQGTMFSPEVNELLMKAGLDTEEAYRVAQELAFEAIKNSKPYLELLLISGRVPDSVKDGKIQKIFDMKNKVKNVNKIFKRNGL